MLSTPSTSHLSFDNVYEPAEDSYFFLDTLSSASESAWLSDRFSTTSISHSYPLLVTEVGTGSGVIIAFITANAKSIFGREDILTLGADVNPLACKAARQTVLLAISDKKREANDYHLGCGQEKEKRCLSQYVAEEPNARAQFLDSLIADLYSPLRPGSVDVLIFNPPYVPTPELPRLPSPDYPQNYELTSRLKRFERDSYLLSLSYAGGADGMETTNRFLDAVPSVLDPLRGVAYVLLCSQNKPEQIKERIEAWGSGWIGSVVGRSGMQAGWERLVIMRIWRDTLGYPGGRRV